MKCPICSREAQEGGLIAPAITINWVPIEMYDKGFLKEFVRIVYPGKSISHQVPFRQSSKVPNAYYCEHCNKVFGIFDVTDNE